jgi:hypothetical protein
VPHSISETDGEPVSDMLTDGAPLGRERISLAMIADACDGPRWRRL